MGAEQAFTTSYPPRLRQYANAFITPVLQTQAIPLAPRTTKRGTAIKNYADDIDDDDFDDDSESTRRPTGIRSLRQQELEKKEAQFEKLGKEIREPVKLQGVYRDWMIRRTVKPTYDPKIFRWLARMRQNPRSGVCADPVPYCSTDQQVHIQAQLPLTLIPIRIDIDIPSHTPDSPFPIPRGLDPAVTLEPQFRRPDSLPAYKLRDIFLWNLHETLITPDDFALNLVRDLDFPNQTGLAMTIASQIREQLQEYAGVALHPLFHVQPKPKAIEAPTNGAQQPSLSSRDGTPRPSVGFGATPRAISATPNPSTPAPSTPQPFTLPNGASVAAHASPIPLEHDPSSEDQQPPHDPYLNPDDTYRCIINLSISLSSKLYSDKFEWSLLHPPGAAEAFAKLTCADLGLGGEWVLAITHAIYEAVLRLKKEACEGGMMMTGGMGMWGQGEVDNQAVNAEEGAGWRYDADDFGLEWEPKIEELSKEEIEKREGDRERQLRRVRRETAKFSSTSGMAPSQREREAEIRGSYFDSFAMTPGAGSLMAGGDDTPGMGRGERSKKKRRFRSLSPVARAVGAATPETAGGVNGVGTGWGGAEGRLQEYERQNWRCRWCLVWGSAVWAVRDGPAGVRVSCFLFFSLSVCLPVCVCLRIPLHATLFY